MIARVISTALITQVAHRANREHWEYRKHGAAKGTEAAHLIQASLFWRLCWLYLLPSHTTPLHKPDSPLSQSWCKQQESFVSSQSWAGEWKSTRWHVICIDSTEGLGDDQRRLSGEAEQRHAAVIHEHLKSLGFVLIFDFLVFLLFFFCVIQTSKSRSDSYPDRRKTPRLHIWMSVVPTFINDRQTTARQASIIWYYVPLRVSAQVCRKQIPLSSFIYLSLPNFLQLAPDRPVGLSGCFFFFFPKEEDVVSIRVSVCFF